VLQRQVAPGARTSSAEFVALRCSYPACNAPAVDGLLDALERDVYQAADRCWRLQEREVQLRGGVLRHKAVMVQVGQLGRPHHAICVLHGWHNRATEQATKRPAAEQRHAAVWASARLSIHRQLALASPAPPPAGGCVPARRGAARPGGVPGAVARRGGQQRRLGRPGGAAG
jgi:hypothetical protein